MPYTSKDWTERLRNRSDMSTYLYHLTKGTDDKKPVDILIKILNERKLIGLAFKKDYVYDKGGRPVFYEKTDIAKTILPKDEYWRIVNFNLSDKNNIIDWTHEREWRIKGDFEFSLEHVYVILVNSKSYKKFVASIDDDILKNIGGIVVLNPVLT